MHNYAYSEVPVSQAEGMPHYLQFVKCGANNDYMQSFVNTAFGNFIHKRTDYLIPSNRFKIYLEFTYNSASNIKSYYGNGWQSNFNISYYTNDKNKNVIFRMPDGAGNLFKAVSSNIYQSTYGGQDSLIKLETGYKLIIFKDNYFNFGDYSEYYFDDLNHNYITRIVDRNSNEIKFVYDSKNKLIQVKYPNNFYFEFEYENNQLTTVNTSSNYNIEYFYNNSVLAQVNFPNTQVVYEYDEICRNIINIKDKLQNKYSIKYDDMFRVMQVELPVDDLNYNFQYNELQTIVEFYGNSIIHTYDMLYRIQRVTYSANENYDYIWDNNYYLLSKKYSPDLRIEYKRNQNGFLTEINRFGIKTQIRLDSRYKKPLESINDDGKQELFEYDDFGNLLSVLKPGNRYLVFDYQNDLINYIDFYGVFSINLSYNITDDLNFIRVPQNKRIIVDYDKDKNITSLFNFNNDRYVLSYTNSLLSNIALPNNTNLLFEYNNNSQLRKATNPIGLVTNFDFDVLNRLIAINNSYSIEYDLNNFQIINFARDTCKYELDLLKRIISKTSPIGLTEHFQWGTAGNLAGYSRNSQHNYSLSYNNNNRLSRILMPDNSNYTFTYNNSGINSILKNNDLLYKFEYNQLDKITNIEYMTGSVASYEYDNLGEITLIQHPDGVYRKYIRDWLGNPILYHNSAGDSLSLVYDGNSNIIAEIEHKGGKTEYKYNQLNYLNEILSDDGKLSYQLNNLNKVITVSKNDIEIKRYNYDLLGNISTIEKNGKLFQFETNSNERITKFTAHINQPILFEYLQGGLLNKISGTNEQGFVFLYNNFGNIQSITNKSFDVNTLFYNNLEQVSVIIDPNSEHITFQRKDGNIVSIEFDSQNKHNFSWDSYNRLVSKSKASGAVQNMYYDLNSRLSQISDYNGYNTLYDYAGNGNLLKITDPMSYATDFNYELNNKISSIKNKNQSTLFIKYKGNKVQSIFNQDYSLLKISYSETDQIREVVLNNGDTLSYSYSQNELNSIKVNGWEYLRILNDNTIPGLVHFHLNQVYYPVQFNNKRLLSSIDFPNELRRQYNYNLDNRISVKSDNLGVVKNYRYDTFGRLSYIFNQEQMENEFKYNAFARLTEFKDHLKRTRIFRYNKDNQITALLYTPRDSVSFQHDNIGNLTAITNRNNITHIYNYNRNNNISQIRLSSAYIINFNYNPMTRNININTSDNSRYDYFFDDLYRISELRDNNILKKQFEYPDYRNVKVIGLIDTQRLKFNKIDLIDEFAFNNNLIKLNYLPNIQINELHKNGNIFKIGFHPDRQTVSFISKGNKISEYQYNKRNQLSQTNKSGENYQLDYSNSMLSKIMQDTLTLLELQYNSQLLPHYMRINDNTFTSEFDIEDRIKTLRGSNNENYGNWLYDAHGNVINFGQSTYNQKFRYDNLGRLTSEEFLQTSQPEKLFEYEYGMRGLPISYIKTSDFPSRINIDYNNNESIRKYSYSFDSKILDSIFYQYNNLGLLRLLAISNLSEMRFEYNQYNTLTAMILPGNLRLQFQYNNSLLSSITYPNNLVSKYQEIDTLNIAKFNIISNSDTLRQYLYKFDDSRSISELISDISQQNFRFERDLSGRITEVYKADTLYAQYEHNKWGRISNIIQDSNNILIEYDSDGKLTKYGSTIYQYENSRVENIIDSNITLKVKYNTYGKVEAIESDSVNYLFYYDARKRLAKMKVNGISKFFLSYTPQFIKNSDNEIDKFDEFIHVYKNENHKLLEPIIIEYDSNRTARIEYFIQPDSKQVYGFRDILSNDYYYVHICPISQSKIITNSLGEIVYETISVDNNRILYENSLLDFSPIISDKIKLFYNDLYFVDGRIYHSELDIYLQMNLDGFSDEGDLYSHSLANEQFEQMNIDIEKVIDNKINLPNYTNKITPNSINRTYEKRSIEDYLSNNYSISNNARALSLSPFDIKNNPLFQIHTLTSAEIFQSTVSSLLVDRLNVSQMFGVFPYFTIFEKFSNYVPHLLTDPNYLDRNSVDFEFVPQLPLEMYDEVLYEQYINPRELFYKPPILNNESQLTQLIDLIEYLSFEKTGKFVEYLKEIEKYIYEKHFEDEMYNNITDLTPFSVNIYNFEELIEKDNNFGDIYLKNFENNYNKHTIIKPANMDLIEQFISAVDNNLLPKNPFDSINRLILENSIYNLKIPNFSSILDFSTELNLINSNSQIELNRYLYPNSALHNVFFNYGVAKKLNIPFYLKTNEKNLHLIKKQPKTIDEMILLK